MTCWDVGIRVEGSGGQDWGLECIRAGGGESVTHVRTTQESEHKVQGQRCTAWGSNPGAPRWERQLQGPMEEQIISPDQGRMLLSQEEGNCKSGVGVGSQVSTRAGRELSINI